MPRKKPKRNQQRKRMVPKIDLRRAHRFRPKRMAAMISQQASDGNDLTAGEPKNARH
jgi:hypothetical protein